MSSMDRSESYQVSLLETGRSHFTVMASLRGDGRSLPIGEVMPQANGTVMAKAWLPGSAEKVATFDNQDDAASWVLMKAYLGTSVS